MKRLPTIGRLRSAKENLMSIHDRLSAAFVSDTIHSSSGGVAIRADGDDRVVASQDAVALSAKIDALIEDRAKLEAAREPYRQRAHQFDFNASVEKMVDLYRSVIAKHREARSITAA
jgi:hypothetical protein